ncbi:hypothetical protein CLV84_0887 [Neolewinella xylanilytica]|uniref:Uncharacterized protein n=1 Tax=Neolewinella xylanilytica TaxID=1514080 RepID=A0A2S6I8X3_9BACT|nr:hypothetical protein [Neolewinella xylanilytica]PPK87928.1 hypothetical protein CLV84_0887 [Neolewinella xylanilytica]
MAFRITYTKLLTLRCWHPDYLGSVAGQVPVADPGALSVAEQRDYLRYDLRPLLDLRPTEAGQATLDRYGLQWKRSTQGGWLLAQDSFSTTDPSVRLQLGVFLLDPGFAKKTNFGVATLERKLFYVTNANQPPVSGYVLTGGNLPYLDSSPAVVRLAQTTPGTDSTVDLRDPFLFNNPILETFAVSGGEATTPEYQLDLRDRPAGRYRFTGANITNQNLAVGFGSIPDLLGVIELQLAGWAGFALDFHFTSSNP